MDKLKWIVSYKDEDGEDTATFDNEKDADGWIKIQEGRRSSGEKFELINKIKITEEKDFMKLYDKNFSKIKKPKYWNSNFRNKVIKAYNSGELTKNNIVEWETKYNGGNKPTPSLGSEEFINYYEYIRNNYKKEFDEVTENAEQYGFSFKKNFNERIENLNSFNFDKNFSLSDMEKDLIKFMGFKELPNYDKISGASLIFDGDDFTIYFGFDEEFDDPSIDVYDKKGNYLGSINGVKTYQIKDLVKKNKNDVIKYLDEIKKFNSKHITDKVDNNFGENIRKNIEKFYKSKDFEPTMKLLAMKHVPERAMSDHFHQINKVLMKYNLFPWTDELREFIDSKIGIYESENFGADDNYGDTKDIEGIDREAVFEFGMSLAHEIYGDDAEESKVWKDVEIAIRKALEENGDTDKAEEILYDMYATDTENFSESVRRRLQNI